MKRTLLTLLATLVAIAAGIDLAQAGSWKTQEVKWLNTYLVGTTITQRDTAFQALGSADDTTAWFSLKDADPPLAVNGAASDTVVLGYLVLAIDTTVTFTATTTNVATTFHFAPKTATSTVVNTTPLNTVAVLTSGDRVAVLPITYTQRGHSGNLGDLIAIMSLSEMNIRAITTGITGGGMPMVRAFVVYYDAEG